MLTLLEKKEDKFFKVPLDDYRKFIELLKKTDLIDASIDELNSKIELAPSMTVKDLEDRLKGKTNEVPKNPTVQRPNKVDNSRIFTDESRIDAKHSYLTVSNAKNLGYLGGIDNNKVKPAKSENKDTYNIFEEEIKNIDMPDQDKIIPLRRIMENKPSIFKRMTNKVGEIKKFFNRDDDFPPIEFTEENSDTPIKGFDPDTVDPQVAQQINLIDQIVDAMIQNKVDGNGKPINSDDQNTNGRHIA